jgi:hypothetical protein
MGKATFESLLADLAGMAVPEEAKRQFEELIRRRAALDGVTSLDRQERVQFARRWLELKESRPVIRDRIMARYDVGRTQAYQVIDQALQLSGFPKNIRTETDSNGASTSKDLNESRLL